jgi:hypothetical protein
LYNLDKEEYIRIQNTQGYIKAVSSKYDLRWDAASFYLRYNPELINKYKSVEEAMKLINFFSML